MYVICFKRATY